MAPGPEVTQRAGQSQAQHGVTTFAGPGERSLQVVALAIEYEESRLQPVIDRVRPSLLGQSQEVRRMLRLRCLGRAGLAPKALQCVLAHGLKESKPDLCGSFLLIP